MEMTRALASAHVLLPLDKSGSHKGTLPDQATKHRILLKGWSDERTPDPGTQ